MMVRDSATAVDHRVERRRFDRRPLLDQLAVAPERMEREVGRRPVGIDVREARRQKARPVALAALLRERLLADGAHALMERRKPLPRDGRLERLAEHAHRDERVAQVRGREESAAPRAHRAATGGGRGRARALPALAEGLLERLAAVLRADLERAFQRFITRWTPERQEQLETFARRKGWDMAMELKYGGGALEEDEVTEWRVIVDARLDQLVKQAREQLGQPEAAGPAKNR